MILLYYARRQRQGIIKIEITVVRKRCRNFTAFNVIVNKELVLAQTDGRVEIQTVFVDYIFTVQITDRAIQTVFN